MSGASEPSGGPSPSAAGTPADGTVSARSAEDRGTEEDGSRFSAFSVGSGIFLSRVTGFVRDVAIGYFFGTGLAVDAYNVALRIPNAIRNLLGEGTLSASFVPVYSSMLEEEGAETADRLARSILGVVIGIAGLLSALGVLLAPLLTRLLVPSWDAGAATLTTTLVRILFPMAGVMIIAAWCLGVLNSHRRFFLPFAAPVMWNLAQIGGLALGWWQGWEPLVHVLAWSTLAGSVLQLGVQLPEVTRLVGRIRPALERTWEPVRRVVGNAVPVISSQGIFQISSILDVFLAGFLAHGALAGLYFAQRLAYLPLSLFGISVAAAALPEMSRETAGPLLRRRLVDGFLQIVYFVLPSAVAFILFGDLVVRVLFERGAFGPESTVLVSGILMAYAVGLVATSSVKLFASGFHALQDTRTPLKLAAVSVGTGVALGAALMFGMQALGLGPLAVSGLILGGALGAWLNLILLWSRLRSRVGTIFEGGELRRVLRLALAALVGGGLGILGRNALSGPLPTEGLPGQIGLLAGTLVAAGVPYLLIAGGPGRQPDTG